MSASKSDRPMPPGIFSGDYVPLEIEEFQEAYATLSTVLAGRLPAATDMPAEIIDGRTQRAQPFPNTPLNRAWYTAGKLFEDEARRARFYWQVNKVMPSQVH